MIDIVEGAAEVHDTIVPTLFVDDLSAELAGEKDTIVSELGGFTELVIQRIHEDGMEVSTTKSIVSASTPSLGDAMQNKLKNRGINYSLRV